MPDAVVCRAKINVKADGQERNGDVGRCSHLTIRHDSDKDVALLTIHKAILMGTVLALFFSNVASTSALQIFTDRAGWEAALVGFDLSTETFDTPVAGALSLSLSSGIVSTATGHGGAAGLDNNSVTGGVFHGGVDHDQSNGFTQIVWTFPAPVVAFGADWRSAAQGAGAVQITGDFDGSPGMVDLGTQLGSPGTGFLGVVGTANFTSILLTSSHAHNGETFEVDNLSLIRSISSVPEPGTWLLFATSIALGFAYRRLRG